MAKITQKQFDKIFYYIITVFCGLTALFGIFVILTPFHNETVVINSVNPEIVNLAYGIQHLGNTIIGCGIIVLSTLLWAYNRIKLIKRGETW
ncbi:hypothetical protein [Methanococcus maripaludis]|uniref:Putative MFS family arabinose efflux permease n=1 Tax=Methanococcus maripaludis TaxID=39152 RepID=A0A7J9PMC7_METMI|nr:hypothetical protein [Methanococcus maripaludis]MBA2864423.1 putative MFS family arabinose efflux permease [Methanococcus maripaludis]